MIINNKSFNINTSAILKIYYIFEISKLILNNIIVKFKIKRYFMDINPLFVLIFHPYDFLNVYICLFLDLK